MICLQMSNVSRNSVIPGFINTYQTFAKSSHFEVGNGTTQGGVTSAAGVVKDEAWQNMVLAYSGATYTIYLNSAQIAQATDAITWKKTGIAYIGSQLDPKMAMYGSVDDVCIYNRALST